MATLLRYLNQQCVNFAQVLEDMSQHQRPSENNMMKAVCIDTPGGPESMLLRNVPRPLPEHGEVLIRVHATALNRADTLQRKGLYPAPPGESEVLGLEAAGTVASVGPGVRECWRLGDRVMTLLSGGGYAEYVAVPEELIMSIPTHLTVYQAAAIPEAWLTAFQLLHFVAQVKEGEIVLVHAGASGVGTAAVQLVRLAGAIPIVTAGSSEKLQMAETLGAAAGFNYKHEDFAEKVSDFTAGRGANVILDCIGGSNWERNVACLATDGRWVLYGLMGGKTVTGDILGKLLSKRGQLLCSLLRSRSLQYKADLVRAFSERALPHFSDPTSSPCHLRPVIDSMFSLDQVADAHRHMEANRNTGKIVINVMNPQ
ncbi:quinone oxidoreductase PIG3 isoform X1 [Salvelinus fontinalis]|uniref:quinone oxidoreductase PIG3 isoform X1 n=3 Tax=Salvelinus fontinalis TaxID=8038 RepID=UPI0024854A01|nr:quinone oxidoreductase PIG3 isoform X1 [Salvelinus fontinalis]